MLNVHSIITQDTLTPTPTAVQTMANAIYQNNPAVLGVLFYGSGLWKELEEDTVLDFYLIVSSFKAYGSPISHRFWGAALPPNVYYAEHEENGKTHRCKYAVMTYRQFYLAAAGYAIAPSIWARFSQPCRLVLSKDKAEQQKLLQALEKANTTFHKRTLPHLGPNVDAKTIWEAGLRETYACELRSEKKGRNTSIFQAQSASFSARTALFAADHPHLLTPQGQAYKNQSHFLKRFLTKANTPFSRLGGKCVTLARLIKAPLTFTGAVAYILWKIERHTGQKLYATPFQHEHPLIGAWPLLFKVLIKKIAR